MPTFNGWKLTAKTADYTVVAADSGTTFSNLGAGGAVNFTLPALAAGLRFRFVCEVDQNITITAASNGTIVAHNDIAANTVALSTASRKVGGGWEVYANSDASKWIVLPYTWATADDGSTCTKATITT